METDVLHGEVLGSPVIGALLFLSTLLWYILHWSLDGEGDKFCSSGSCAGLVSLCSSQRATSGCKDPAALLCQRRKLKRMHIYCIIASLAAFVFIIKGIASKDPMEETCCGFSPGHQVAFTLAAGHWIVDIWEDWCSRSYLGQGLDGEGLALFPLNLCCTPYQVMFTMYLIHHVVTIFAYCFSLATHSLGGVMVQGLLFELPVVLMSRRDLAVILPEAPAWLLDRSALQCHWKLTYAAFFLGRLPAEGLWVYSMIPGRGPELMDKHMGSTERSLVYHILAVFFTSLNIRIVGLLMSWHQDDLRRLRAHERELSGTAIRSVASSSSEVNEEIPRISPETTPKTPSMLVDEAVCDRIPEECSRCGTRLNPDAVFCKQCLANRHAGKHVQGQAADTWLPPVVQATHVGRLRQE